jgi:hypothetical protein
MMKCGVLFEVRTECLNISYLGELRLQRVFITIQYNNEINGSDPRLKQA